jgi:hypothetical protein
MFAIKNAIGVGLIAPALSPHQPKGSMQKLYRWIRKVMNSIQNWWANLPFVSRNRAFTNQRGTTVTVSDIANPGLYQSDPNLVNAANTAITTFEQDRTPGAWDFLDKTTIIAEIRDRVQNPFLINQGGQPFCGPASVLFELVRKQPLRYVQICQSLYTVGGFQAATQWIAAPDALRHNSRGELHMGQADWMVLATLRQSENLLFPVEPNAPELIRNIAGMTKSWEMKGWIREILGYRNADYYHAYLLNDITALTAAADTIGAGGVAFALITAEGMLQATPPPIPFPSHWIVLLGNIKIQGDRVSFDIYTWSKKLHLDLDQGAFKKYFWACVTGTP